jgi:hypothetical protein
MRRLSEIFGGQTLQELPRMEGFLRGGLFNLRAQILPEAN